MLFGAEEHLRKSRAAKDGEFLRPYKRILPDVISSEVALLPALSIANDLYLALDRQGYRVHIAPAGEMNRPGFAGGSNFQIGWSHDEQNDEQVFP